MKRGKFEEIILQILGKNNQDFPIDGREAGVIAEAVFNEILSRYKYQSIPEEYYRYEECEVLCDSKRGLYYLKPSFTIAGISNASIKRVQPLKDIETEFIITRQGEIANFAGGGMQDFGGRPLAFKDDFKGIVCLYNLQDPWKSLRLWYVPQLSELGEEDEFMTGTLDQTLIEDILSKLSIKKSIPEDTIQDGTA